MGHGLSTAGWHPTCSEQASQLPARQALTQLRQQLRHVGQSAGKCTTLRRVCDRFKQPHIGSCPLWNAQRRSDFSHASTLGCSTGIYQTTRQHSAGSTSEVRPATAFDLRQIRQEPDGCCALPPTRLPAPLHACLQSPAGTVAPLVGAHSVADYSLIGPPQACAAYRQCAAGAMWFSCHWLRSVHGASLPHHAAMRQA